MRCSRISVTALQHGQHWHYAGLKVGYFLHGLAWLSLVAVMKILSYMLYNVQPEYVCAYSEQSFKAQMRCEISVNQSSICMVKQNAGIQT